MTQKRDWYHKGWMTRECSTCRLAKPYACFYLHRRRGDGSFAYDASCKACQSARARRWAKDNPKRHRDNRRRHAFKATYGITEADYDRLLAEQGGVCAICGLDEPASHGRTGTQFRLSVDHCHETGAIRGILCQKCNRAIGLLGDDPELLTRAIQYLTRKASR